MSFGGQEFPTKQVNEVGSLVVMLMDLEPVVQSEVSQKEDNKYIKVYMWNLEKWYQ